MRLRGGLTVDLHRRVTSRWAGVSMALVALLVLAGCRVVLEPESRTVVVNEPATLVTTVSWNDAPVPDAPVTFWVTGPTADWADPRVYTGYADESGQVIFTYTNEVPGTDTVVACVVDVNNTALNEQAMGTLGVSLSALDPETVEELLAAHERGELGSAAAEVGTTAVPLPEEYNPDWCDTATVTWLSTPAVGLTGRHAGRHGALFTVGVSTQQDSRLGGRSFSYQDSSARLSGVQVSGLSVSGSQASVYGTARLASGQDVFFRFDAVDNGFGLWRDTFRLRLFDPAGSFEEPLYDTGELSAQGLTITRAGR